MSPFLQILSKLIRLYQRTLSPDHGYLQVLFPGGVCRFEPTCSEYMQQAITRYGWAGIMMGLNRLGRCHPFHKGGYDPLKPSRSL
jgi:putative membrane protein insertion efficiency factor